MEDRLAGDGELSLAPRVFSDLRRVGVAGSRPFQKSRGDGLPSEALMGEDWNGDESPFWVIFCVFYISVKVSD